MHVLHACCILASVSSGINYQDYLINYHDYCGGHSFVSTGQKRLHMTKLVAKPKVCCLHQCKDHLGK